MFRDVYDMISNAVVDRDSFHGSIPIHRDQSEVFRVLIVISLHRANRTLYARTLNSTIEPT